KNYATYSGFDALGNPGSAAYGSGLTSTYGYYSVDQALGRLHTATLSKGSSTLSTRTFAWNPFGQLKTVSVSPDTSLSESFTFDSMGWLKTAQGPYPAESFTYDLAGNVKTSTGRTYTYPASSDRLSSTSDGLSLGYDGNGNVTSRSVGGTTTTYVYDGSSNLVRITEGSTNTLQAVYDAEGLRLKRTDAGGVVSRYLFGSYSMVEENGKTRYTRIVEGPHGPVAALTTDASNAQVAQELRYQSQLLSARLYDTGNLRGLWASLGARSAALLHHPRLAENLLNLLLAALCSTFLLLGLAGSGWRRLKGLLGGRAAPDWAVPGRPTTAYARGHGFYARVTPWVLAAMTLYLTSPASADLGSGSGYPQTGEVYFLVNQVESVVQVTDGQGNFLTKVAYEPFGEIDGSRSSGPDDFRPKFTSQERDDGTGLYYFGARYQDPSLGRFLQPDPDREYASPYAYVGNDPEDAIDPDGEFAITLTVILVGAIIGAIAGAYFGGAAVNHSYNPTHWDWRSGKTYAGIFAGAAIGAVGGALGAVAGEAGVAAGIAGEMLIGAGENAAFTALGGGSLKEIAISA
ncbi:MAG: RHS repeat-associated core domain-containing protein, partial [Acidobacteria bacterium]|nr:RHS repeat-associated core domain-containing protein [Acidobacteriota bacterium]